MKAGAVGLRLAIVVGLLAAHPVLSRSLASQEGGSRLNLGIVSASVGDEARVPFLLTLERGTKIERLTGEIRFTQAGLTFQKAELSENLEALGAKIETKVEVGSTDATAVLNFALSMPGDWAPPPSSQLLELVFSVAEDADDTEMLSLDLKAEATRAGETADKIENLAVYGGGVTVLGPNTLFGCFFYMH